MSSIPYILEERPDTGMNNSKLGIWIFIASEIMLFGGLFSAYVFLRIAAPEGDFDYWDGERKFGYGGYKYIKGYFAELASELIKKYNLKILEKMILFFGKVTLLLLYRKKN